MRSEQEVRARIKEIEDLCPSEEDDCYLDEAIAQFNDCE